MVQLKTVEIPGLADCLKRERQVRDEAFLEGMPEEVGGIPVASLTLRHLHWLTMFRNGFVVPCTFESTAEMLEHAQQCLWVLTPGLELPSIRRGFTLRYRCRITLAKWFAAVRFLRAKPESVVADLRDYMEETFFDCPFKSEGDSKVAHSSPTIAASVIDLFAGAGYPWSKDDILDTPLKQLWQLARVAIKRLNPEASAPNPSDILKVNELHRMNMERAAEKERTA